MFKNQSRFFDDVYAVVALIPKGRVTSYGAIAHYLGSKRSARMVGWAMNATPKKQGIPAHRVVNHAGLLTGKHHFKTPTTMERQLKKEGVEVRNNKVVNFQKCFWNPTKDLT